MTGPYVIESFHPGAVNWYKEHRPEVCRGQLAEPASLTVPGSRSGWPGCWRSIGSPVRTSWRSTGMAAPLRSCGPHAGWARYRCRGRFAARTNSPNATSISTATSSSRSFRIANSPFIYIVRAPPVAKRLGALASVSARETTSARTYGRKQTHLRP